MLHTFTHRVSHITPPPRFTCPFHYVPHPLCVLAAEEVQTYLQQQPQWADELQRGKMFGVLVVQDKDGQIGYLSAFSGNLDGQNNLPFFVPPVYDLLRPDDFFKREEAEISAINQRIGELSEDAPYHQLRQAFEAAQTQAENEIAEAKQRMKTAKEQRDKRRKQPLSAQEEDELIGESQFLKAETRRLERRWQTRLDELRQQLQTHEAVIDRLKQERKTRSANLQLRIFKQFRMLNARGEVRDLCDIFSRTPQQTPPAGAGECAAPKLLQHAYLHRLRPLCMAEFWWGASPQNEVRHHGFFYPACKSKCEPILNYMLQGLKVDDNPLQRDEHTRTSLEIIYEDDALLAVNKPAGMLSVPGKSGRTSVYSLLRQRFPENDELTIVHRLDMDTSGILLIAKSLTIYKKMQQQFANHTVKKRYIALLDGLVTADSGIIDLPLCANVADRPRQMVSEAHGKSALTRYEVLERRADNRTLVAFWPQTGRTHQLRVHAAHALGLNAPIVGDALYGLLAVRLCLHAEYIEFRHPLTGDTLALEVNGEFWDANAVE